MGRGHHLQDGDAVSRRVPEGVPVWWRLDRATGDIKRVPRGEVKHALKRDNGATKKQATNSIIAVEYRRNDALYTDSATFKYGTRAEVNP